MNQRTEHFNPDAKPSYTPRFPGVEVVPNEDRYAMIANIANEIRKAGGKQDDINAFYTESRKGTYQDFMHVARQWVVVEFVW
jgi:hypothetical protein